jgi:adenylylsulfate kinase-like enzyme
VFAILGGLARQGRTVIALTQGEDLAAAQQSVHVVDGRVVWVEVQG